MMISYLKMHRGVMLRVGICTGLLLALYTVYIDMKFSEDNDFIASCDISEYVSCTAVLTSEYSKLFSKLGILEKDSFLDLPNSHYGKVVMS